MSDYLSVNNLSETQYKILRNIINLRIKKVITWKQLSNLLNINRTNPQFIEAIKICIEKRIIIEYKTFDCLRVLEINNKKLEKFIRENSEEFKLWGKFIETTTIGYNY